MLASGVDEDHFGVSDVLLQRLVRSRQASLWRRVFAHALGVPEDGLKLIVDHDAHRRGIADTAVPDVAPDNDLAAVPGHELIIASVRLGAGQNESLRPGQREAHHRGDLQPRCLRLHVRVTLSPEVGGRSAARRPSPR